MPLKASGYGTRFEEVDRFDGGVGWIAHPEETMQRASHALATDEGVWIVEPVDANGVDDLVDEFGDVVGVVVLVDRHSRDADKLARRHDVPVYVPSFVDASIPAETRTLSDELPGTAFDVFEIVDWPGWTEAALYDGDTLVVGDSLGTAPYFLAGRERVGVHPLLRVKPPRILGNFQPERVLTGHGRGVMEDGADALDYALDGARSRAPQVWLKGLKSLF